MFCSSLSVAASNSRVHASPSGSSVQYLFCKTGKISLAPSDTVMAWTFVSGISSLCSRRISAMARSICGSARLTKELVLSPEIPKLRNSMAIPYVSSKYRRNPAA